MTRLPCPWPTCDEAWIAIEAISADGSHAVATAGFEKSDPLSIVRRSYLVNLRTGSHRRIPTLATSKPD